MKMRSKFSSLLLVSAAVVTAQSASAADLPARPAYKAPVQIVSWDWTGPYLGVYAGIAASRSRSFDPTGAVAGVIEHTGYGLSAGGTIGYNWQTSWNIMGGAVVVGLEGDIGYFNAGPERHGLEHRRRLRSRHVVDGHRPRPRRSRDRPEPHLLHRRLRRARPRRPVHRRRA